MSYEARKYLDGFIDETIDTWWCNGYNVFIRTGEHSIWVGYNLNPNWGEIRPAFKIPSQENLQEMANSELNYPDAWSILCYEFMDYVKTREYGNDTKSMVELWLRFAMKICFNKIWDEETCKWIKPVEKS